jgi:hypothetical protein
MMDDQEPLSPLPPGEGAKKVTMTWYVSLDYPGYRTSLGVSLAQTPRQSQPPLLG